MIYNYYSLIAVLWVNAVNANYVARYRKHSQCILFLKIFCMLCWQLSFSQKDIHFHNHDIDTKRSLTFTFILYAHDESHYLSTTRLSAFVIFALHIIVTF